MELINHRRSRICQDKLCNNTGNIRKAKQKLKKWKDDDKLTKWNFNQWTIVKKLKLTTTKEASRERRLGQLMQGNA
ncbi:hypothetical protein NC653_005959 [Populus alba x Populus x berolinensis]|uniref:Uncharacterized protein n=1 Tax=Populus alba x Populus x berolinensis TaxID=444605 RepID=A0AAD6WBZ8_9ROSI|nr:hypothetical protein NC653_005959 [Populus alba x Populus x berolinensis]